MRAKWAVMLVAGGLLPAALPAAASVTDKQLHIERLDTAPHIDGRLDDAIWEQATRIDDLHQVRPLEFAPAGERTEIRVFYTREALYVAARMCQDPERITANIQQQGAEQRIWDDDWFGFDIDPWNAQRNGYFFVVNANGVRWDGSFKNISGFDHDWSGIWEGAARRDERGWTVEFALPFSTVSFNPDTDTWGFNFERRIARTGEYIAWSSRGQQVNPSTNGAATGFSGIRQGLGLSVMPSVVAHTTRADGPEARDESRFEPSLDVSYRITPELSSTLTVNTDFSATEVDTRRVNLSRFSLFFPEKRDFFLRDADIFEFGHLEANGRPFFSRSIGLNRNGHPIDIDYGAKLSGHFDAFDLGSLYIRQEADPETGIGERDILVARGAAHLFSESSVGLILTSGDPQSELDNNLAGADFSLRNSRLAEGRELRFDGWFQHSEPEGLTGMNDAWGLALTTLKPAGWYGSAGYQHIGENFRPALGFVNRNGIEDLTSQGGYKWRFGRGNFFELIDVGGDYYRADTLADGRLGSSLGKLRVNASTQQGDSLGIAVYDSRERLTEDFTIYAATDGSGSVVIPAGEYAFTEGEITLDTNAARRFSTRLVLRAGEYFDGNHHAGEIELAWKPNRHLNALVSLMQDQIHLPDGDFTVRLMSLSATVAFDAHWSWTTVAQYDNVSEVLGFNSRLHWTPRAGRNAWLVINVGREDRDRDRRFQSMNSQITLKYSHDLRF